VINNLKRQSYYVWLDTPEEKRNPKTEKQFARMAPPVTVQTLNTWKANRDKLEIAPIKEIAERLGNDVTPTDSGDISVDEKGALARKVWKDAMKHGASASEKDLAVRMLGMLIEKKEEIHHHELTSEAEERIAQRVAEIQQKFNASRGRGAESGEDSLQTKSTLLS